MDFFALFVLLVLIAAGILLLVLVGSYPGKYAKQVNHPQADAINCMAWVGVFTLGVLWLAALIWSRVKHPEAASQLETEMVAEVKS